MKRSLVGVVGCLGVLVIGGVIAALMAAATYNNLVRRSQEVDRQWAQVQNVYQRRADLIPNLVKTVSGAANFERSTLTEIVEARASVGRVSVNATEAPDTAAELESYQQAQSQLSSSLSRLLVVVERYPELKANANFINLQAQLEGTENRIAVERGRFNESVQRYNTVLKRFPTVLIAGMLGFEAKPYFTATPGSERPPEVRFDFGGATSTPAQR
ncbi:MAG: LemA family protein [Verrucomicrobiia bacterium]